MDRTRLLRRGVWLEIATVGWNVIEGVVAVSAGALASSVALISFGVDSFVETAGGAELGQVAEVLRAGEPEERKRVVRCFLQGIRIEKATRQAVLRWYRLPRASFVKLVELRGVEPLTPRLPALCSPN